jgi:hypothetical protein
VGRTLREPAGRLGVPIAGHWTSCRLAIYTRPTHVHRRSVFRAVGVSDETTRTEQGRQGLAVNPRSSGRCTNLWTWTTCGRARGGPAVHVDAPCGESVGCGPWADHGAVRAQRKAPQAGCASRLCGPGEDSPVGSRESADTPGFALAFAVGRRCEEGGRVYQRPALGRRRRLVLSRRLRDRQDRCFGSGRTAMQSLRTRLRLGAPRRLCLLEHRSLTALSRLHQRPVWQAAAWSGWAGELRLSRSLCSGSPAPCAPALPLRLSLCLARRLRGAAGRESSGSPAPCA